MSANERAKLMILDTLNDVFLTVQSEEKCAVSFACVVLFDDGSTDSNMAGDLNRVMLNGALYDLTQQIFWESKNREINDAVENAVQQITLATTPTDGKAN